MALIELNGARLEAEAGSNLLLAALKAGVDIPHLCYHPGLSVPANCRVCLTAVGRDGDRRLVPACDAKVTEGMVVDTLGPDVVRAREEALEFLLVGHALDCPVCAKAGECELQSRLFTYGRGQGRYAEDHPAHPKVDLGPRIRLYADRCIGCTRCIRFCDEVSTSGELGRIGRGERAHVAIFPGRQLDNPLSGNIVDLCPVGALVEKEAHIGPPVWQLRGVDSVCAGCSTGCNVRVDVHRDRVVRIKPRYNAEVNQYWICDEGRYGWDYVDAPERLDRPQIRRGDRLEDASWDEALELVAKRMGLCEPEAIAAAFSASASNEENFLLGRLVLEAWQTHWVALRQRETAEGEQRFGEHLTIRADKAPNARGVAEVATALGIELQAVEDWWRAMGDGRIRAAFLLAGHPREQFGEAERQALAKVEFLVVQGMAESALSAMASVVLPGASAFEKDGTFTNADGQIQRTRRAVPLPGNARPDWQILAHLGQLAGLGWDYGDPGEIAVELGKPYVAAMQTPPEGRSAQAYGGGWATWLQRRGFIRVEDHTKQV